MEITLRFEDTVEGRSEASSALSRLQGGTTVVEVTQQSNGWAQKPDVTDMNAPATPDTPATPPAAPSTDGYEPKQGLDATKLPWDSRIHSSNGKRTLKNVWCRRKGITDELFGTVSAEIGTPPPTADAPPPPSPPVATTPPPPPAPEPEMIYDHNGQPFTKQQLLDAGWSEGQIAELPATPVVSEAPSGNMFAEFMQKIISSGIDKDTVDVTLLNHGVSSTAEVSQKLHLIPAILKALAIL